MVPLPAEDVSLHLVLIVGDAPAAVRLASQVRDLARQSIRFRLPDAVAGLSAAPTCSPALVTR